MQKLENVQAVERGTNRGKFAECKPGETWFFKIGIDYKIDDNGKETLRTSASQYAKKHNMRTQTQTVYNYKNDEKHYNPNIPEGEECGLDISWFAKKTTEPNNPSISQEVAANS